MPGGTACELKPGTGRKTKVQYICNPNAFHNEILRYKHSSFRRKKDKKLFFLENHSNNINLQGQKFNDAVFYTGQNLAT